MGRHPELDPDIVAFVTHLLEKHGVDTEHNIRTLAHEVQATIEMFMDEVIDTDDEAS